MFVFSKEQMQRFADFSFLNRVYPEFKKLYPEKIVNGEGFDALGFRLLDRARQYGLQDELSQAVFLELAFSVSETFDEIPQVRAVLTDMSLTAQEKLDKLEALDDILQPQANNAKETCPLSAK